MESSPKEQTSEPVAFVIFGVTGDLTRRKLIPALYELLLSERLPGPIYIVGFARREWDDEFLQRTLKEGVQKYSRTKPVNEAVLEKLVESAHYVCADFNDPEGYLELASLLDAHGTSNCLFYLATPPDAYSEIIQQIGKHKLAAQQKGWRRIIIEKPYGRDMASAQALEKEVHGVFEEDQLYRIDHYLGKETVQNILVFRFANGIFEPLWNSHYVDHVQITVSETEGVGTRAGYYETSGVIRDVFQNHLLQLLTLTAMEAPVAFNAEAVRDEKVKVLRALRPLRDSQALANTFRAQYVSGMVDDERVVGYKDEPGVSGTSVTETFMAARVFVDNWRWAGVPFYLRSGKRLPCRWTEISIQFRQVPLSLFGWHNMAGDAPNVLVLKLQPDEGITLSFGAKAPGPMNQITPVKMDFSYAESFKNEPPEAYERLLLDCIMGDATLFTRSDEVASAWAFTSGIIDAWKSQPVRNLPVYEAGTWGPESVDEFIRRGGREWRNMDF